VQADLERTGNAFCAEVKVAVVAPEDLSTGKLRARVFRYQANALGKGLV
jgi:hypothetical protein